MLKEIKINNETYTPLAWANIHIGSRSSCSYNALVKEIQEVFKGTEEEAKGFVSEYTELRGSL